jgi:putative flippase GtrA
MRNSALIALARAVHARSDLAFLRFGLVGIVNTALDLFLFTLGTAATDLAPALINIFSYGTGICCSFLLNSLWTFKHSKIPSAIRLRLTLFVILNLINLVLSTVLLAVFVQWMPPLMGKILTIPVIFAIGYFGSTFIVFSPRNR